MRLNFMVLSIAAFAFVLTVLLLSKAGKADDAKRRMIKSITKDDVVKIEHEELEQSFSKRFLAPILNKLKEFNANQSKKKKEKNEQVVDEKKLAKVKETERLLRMSGMHTSYQNYNFARLAFSIIFSILAIGFAIVLGGDIMMTVLIIFVGVVLAMFLPKFILKTRVSSHQQAIKAQLPDVLDLLSVCTSAGLSFDSALSKVIEKMEGPFIDELSTVFNQMQMGVPRNEAMNALSDCTDIQELKTFVSAIVQANTLGIPITNVMSVQAKQLRDARRETAREKGNKAATKMALPIMLFIFPALFIVILGPVVMNVSGSLG